MQKTTSVVPRRSKSPPSPCNMYIGVNFSVRLSQIFKFRNAVQSNKDNGVVMTQFDPFRNMNKMSLSEAAKRLRDVPNAGGSSVVSEVLSFEVLRNCFGANLLKTEMEVEYFPEGGSITDYTCEMFSTTLGVSVTRAMKYGGGIYEHEDAAKLLNKKLKGILQSSRNTLEKWSKQILHVWAGDSHIASTLTAALRGVESAVIANTVVLITVASNAPEVFYNQ